MGAMAVAVVVRRPHRSAMGAVLGRMNQSYVYANGQQVASLDGAGKLDVVSRMTAFSNSSSGKSQTVVQAGETLRNIAQRVYGNANLWYVLAAANALEGDGDLVAGATLTVPEVKTSSNDANTFKPYNPGEITGPTSPGLPYIEPPDKGCGTLGIIIMVVVIAVVAYVTAGAASGAMTSAAANAGSATALASTATVTTVAGVTTTAATLTTLGSITAGAIGAAAGAAAGMAVGSAMGVASFSWRDVAQAGISAFLTAGLASTGAMRGVMALAGNSQFARGAITAAAGQMTSYAASRIAGVDASFSWRRIAVSAVSAGLTSTAMPRVGPALNIDLTTERGQFAVDLVGGSIGGTLAMHASRKLGLGGDVNYGRVLSDAFGNTLGNAATGEMKRRSDMALAQQRQTAEVLARRTQAVNDALSAKLDQRIEQDVQAFSDRFQERVAGQMDQRSNESIVAGQERINQEFQSKWKVAEFARIERERVAAEEARLQQVLAGSRHDGLSGAELTASLADSSARIRETERQAEVRVANRLLQQANDLRFAHHTVGPIPEPTMLERINSLNPIANSARMITGALGDVLVSVGLGDRIPADQYGPEYRVHPFSGNWMSPGDVKDTRFMTLTGLVPVGRAATASSQSLRSLADDLAVQTNRLNARLVERGIANSSGALPYDRFAGVREASEFLQAQGVPRKYRVQTLQSFEIDTIQVRVAGEAEFGTRYFDNVEATARGRYLFETFPASREGLALKSDWNQMTYLQQWRIRPGAAFFEGRASSQGAGYPGGQIQKYVLNPDKDLLFP